MTVLRKYALVAFLPALLLATGCDSGTADGVTGEVRLLLTETPAPVAAKAAGVDDDLLEANVTIERIEALTEDSTVVLLADDPQPFDLMVLREGLTAELAVADLPEGNYSQLRVYVAEDATVLLADSTVSPLKIPSGTTSGIKLINIPPIELDTDGEVVEVTLEFDVDDSFVKAGNSGKYIFKPVVKLVSLSLDGVPQEVPDDDEAEQEEDPGT